MEDRRLEEDTKISETRRTVGWWKKSVGFGIRIGWRKGEFEVLLNKTLNGRPVKYIQEMNLRRGDWESVRKSWIEELQKQ